MNIIDDDFSMKMVAGFALFLVLFGGGGLIGALIAYLTVPMGLNLDFQKSAGVGAAIGIAIAVLAILYAVFSKKATATLTVIDADDLSARERYKHHTDVFK